MTENGHRDIALVLVMFIICSGIYSFVLPIFNAPDEPFHFEYIRFLSENKRLPDQTEKEMLISTEAFNPPLYYIVNAFFLSVLSTDNASDIGIHSYQELTRFYEKPYEGFRNSIYPPLNPNYKKFGWGREKNMFLTTEQDWFPFSGSIRVIHLLRIISVIFGALTIFFTYKTARIITPDSTNIALLSASLCAFNPQFNFLSGSLNNDNLVILFATISIWLLTKFLLEENHSSKLMITMGISLGLGLITKVNIAFLILLCIICIILNYMRGKEKDLSGLVWNIGYLIVPILIISGWFFVRNIYLYGLDDPLGWRLRAIQNPELVLNAQNRIRFFQQLFFQQLFTSFWGRFDWLTIPLPYWAYWIYAIISMIGVFGITLGLKKERLRTITLFYLIAILMAIISLVVLNLNFSSAQARLIFTVIAPLCLFISMGFNNIVESLGFMGKNAKISLWYFILMLLGLNIYTLIMVIYPVYR